MTLTATRSTVAYFSMEICLEQAIPTYSGGLGVLAGDTLRSAADLGVPLVAVTLLHRKGYFEQHLDASGQQTSSRCTGRPRRCSSRWTRAARCMIEGRDGARARVEVRREGRARARGAGVPARHECCPRTRSGTARSPTRCTAATSTIGSARRSCSAWAAPALLQSIGYRWRHDLPPERRPLGAADAAAPRAAARRPPALRARRRGPRGGAAALRLHDAHAGAGGPRQVPARHGAARARRRARRAARGLRRRARGDAQHDAPRAAPRRASSTAWRCGIARCRAGCSPTIRSTRSPTACTP